MNKIKVIFVVVFVIIFTIAAVGHFTNEAIQERSTQSREGKVICADGNVVPSECAFSCGNPVHAQICIDNLKKIEEIETREYPADTTNSWYEAQKVIIVEFFETPTIESCNQARNHIVGIQDAIDYRPGINADDEVYLKGIILYENAIKEHCQEK